MVQAISRTTLTDAASVKVTMRFLREAGLLTHGAHGVNAPDMTSMDLAHALIAHMAYEKLGSRSAEAVKELGGMLFHDPDLNTGQFTLEHLRGLKPPFSFAQGLASLIEVYAFDWDTDAYHSAERQQRDGEVKPPSCRVEIYFEEDGPGASIRMGPWRDADTGTYLFAAPAKNIREVMAALDEIPPIGSLRWISERNIKPLAEEFSGIA